MSTLDRSSEEILDSDPSYWPRPNASLTPDHATAAEQPAHPWTFGANVFKALPTATALLAPSGIVVAVNAQWTRLAADSHVVGHPLWRCFAPAERSHITALIARVRDAADADQRNRTTGEPGAVSRPVVTGTQLRHHDGRCADVALRLAATREHAALTLIAEVECLAGSQPTVLRRPGTGDRQLALTEIARSAIAGTDLARIGDSVTATIAHVTGCPLVGLWRRASRDERFVLMTGVGFGARARGSLVLDGHEGSLADHAIRSRGVVVMGGPTGTAAELPSALVERGISNGVAVALPGSTGADGLLTVCAPHNQPLDPDDVRFLGIVGDLLAMTLQRESVDQLITAERQRTALVAGDLQRLQQRHDLAAALTGAHDWCWTAPEPVSARRRGATRPRWSAHMCIDAGPQAVVDCAVDSIAAEVARALNAALADDDELELTVPLRVTDGAVDAHLRGHIDRDPGGLVRRVRGVATVQPHATTARPDPPAPVDGRNVSAGDLLVLDADADVYDPRHLAHIGHDLNNLLAAVLGTAQHLIDLGGDRRRLTAIVRASRRARELIAGLRPGDESGHPLADAYDVSEVVDHLQPLLRGMLGRDVRLVVRLGEDVHAASPSREQLEHVMLDLVANSRDALTDHGAVMVATGTCVQIEHAAGAPPPGRWARVRVCDNGAGMTTADRDRVFTAGFTTRPGRDHSGLGLATVRAIVDRAGGLVTIDSTPGRGTAVDVYLPLAHRPAARLQPLRALALPRSTPPRVTTGSVESGSDAAANDDPTDDRLAPVALVVDDEPALRQLLSELLDRLGYHTVVAVDGAHALEQTRGLARLDLVISDLAMPRLGGLALLREIRRDFADVAVVLLSGAPLDTRIIDRRVRVLRKPFEWSNLRDEIASISAHPQTTPAVQAAGGT